MNIFLISAAIVGGILYVLFKKRPQQKLSRASDALIKKENLITFYNYYKIPVRVSSSIGEMIVEKIEPKSFVAVHKDKLPADKNIEVYGIFSSTSNTNEKNVLLNIHKVENDFSKNHFVFAGEHAKTESKELHIGLNSAYEDLSLVSEGTRSTLGTALPRLNIINHTHALMRFQIGSDQICIEGGRSKMYFGEENHGIHMGVKIENIDGILPDFVISGAPITDLHLGLLSHKALPLYSGVKMEGEPVNKNLNYHTLELFSKPHRGSLADRTFII